MLAFHLSVSEAPVFFFLQTILGTRVTFVGKNINITAASKSTETYMRWMVSTALALRYPNSSEKSLGKADGGCAGPCSPWRAGHGPARLAHLLQWSQPTGTAGRSLCA